MVSIVALAATVSTTRAEDNSHGLRVGEISIAGSYASVPVAFTNNADGEIGTAVVSCGFLREDGFPTAQGLASMENVAPGDTAYAEVVGSNASDATSADCRIVEAQ